MSQFLFFAALLSLLAVALAVSALWRSTRWLALAIALGLPVTVAGLYYLIGTPAALDPQRVNAPKTLDEAIVQLQKRLIDEPDNFEGWALLGSSYMTAEKFDLARDAFAKAHALEPENTDAAVAYVEASLRAASDHRLPDNTVALLEKVLGKDPSNQRALFFLGLHHMQSNRPAEAAATWEKLLPLLPPDTAQALRGQINRARQASNLPPLPEPAAVAGPSLSVTVQIDSSLASQAKPGDTLYIFARRSDGAGPPVAAKRIALDRLPLNVTLSDADSLMPTAKLSSQKTVVVMARLSKSGNAQAASGDIETDPLTSPLADAAPITLTLSRAIP